MNWHAVAVIGFGFVGLLLSPIVITELARLVLGGRARDEGAHDE